MIMNSYCSTPGFMPPSAPRIQPRYARFENSPSRSRLDVRHGREQTAFAAARIIFKMRRHIENHRLPPWQSVRLPMRNQSVARIACARKRDESLTHLSRHRLSLRTDGGGAGFVDVVEHQLKVGRVGRAELAALSRARPIKLISKCRKTRLGALFCFNDRRAPGSSGRGGGK